MCSHTQMSVSERENTCPEGNKEPPADRSQEEAGGGDLEGRCIGLERGEASRCRVRAGEMQGRGQVKEVLKERNRPVSTDLRMQEEAPSRPLPWAAALPAGGLPQALTLVPADMWPVNVFSHRCWPSLPSHDRQPAEH